MQAIKKYVSVNRADASKSFGISRMEDIYVLHEGKPDEPHRHDFYTVVLVKKAGGKHIIDFNEYQLSSHQVYFISPGQVHQLLEDEQSFGYAIVFSNQFMIENNIPTTFIDDIGLFNDYGQSPPLIVDEQQLAKLSDYCEEILTLNDSNMKFKEQAIGSLLKLYLIICNDICSQKQDNLPVMEAGNTLLRDFKQLVEQYYSTWHATSTYAEHMHITPDHLNRTVKSLIGKTAKEYIQSRITIAAKRMLYFSDASAKEVGYELGFSEPANFSAFFKKCVGISPSQFKK